MTELIKRNDMYEGNLLIRKLWKNPLHSKIVDLYCKEEITDGVGKWELFQSCILILVIKILNLKI